MPDERRLRRLEKQILHVVAPLVAHGLADPRLRLVTVTRIRLSADLSIARVNWSCLGNRGERSTAAHALEHARGRIQAEVAKAMRTRTTPRLEFHFDESLERAQRVQDILARLREEREGAPEPAAPPEE
jgi:ribosome-binding factor A